MRPVLCRTLLVLVLSLGAGASAAEKPPDAPRIAHESSVLLKAAVPGEHGPGCAVLVARGERVLFRAARGRANVELDVPLSPDQVFLIGSNTKQFTAAAILKLVDQGRLSLDDPLSKFFPDYPGGAQIRIAQLLNHTSGIREFASLPPANPDQRDFTTAQLIALFRDQPPDFAPGTAVRYSNSGYVLLGAILEQLTGKSWPDAIRELLIEPLGLTQTRVSEVEPIFRGRVAGYSHDAQGQVINVESTNTSGAGAAGGLATTLDDFFHWLRALHGGRVLSAESYRRMTTPEPVAPGLTQDFGYGTIRLRLRGHTGFWHSGNIGGFESAQAYFPDAALTVIVLANNDSAPPDAILLMQRLAGLALGQPFAVRKPVSLSADEMVQVAGTYRVDAAITRRIEVREGKLVVQRSDGIARELLAASPDEFFLPDRITTFHTVRDASGKVVALERDEDTGDALPREPRIDGAP